MKATSEVMHAADIGCSALTAALENRVSFLHLRYGDGAIECINGIGSGTCDGERYTHDLGADLLLAWDAAVNQDEHLVYIGDWRTASFEPTDSSQYAVLYDRLIKNVGKRVAFVHFESLLFMRESEALRDFYMTLKLDPRRKLLMGPDAMVGAAKSLDAEFLPVPMGGLHRRIDSIDRALRNMKFDILLWGAGMASSIPVVQAWQRNPERTFINLGSALDPLYMGKKTRKQQVAPEVARRMMRGIFA